MWTRLKFRRVVVVNGRGTNVIAALFVMKDGPYFGVDGLDPYDFDRNAFTYRGPHPVIAHPPCERWGRYWGGGPMLQGTQYQKYLGDDGGCFAHSLWCVRTFGGVIEHPEASHAFRFYGLPIPNFSGGWSVADRYGGRSCCVAQGKYGHLAQKMTWLYGVNIDFRELNWGRAPGLLKIEEGFYSKEERRRLIRTGVLQRLSKKQRAVTPEPFRDLLIELVVN